MTNVTNTVIDHLTKNVDFDAGPKIRHLLSSTENGRAVVWVYDRASSAKEGYDNIKLGIELSDGVKPSEAVALLEKSIEAVVGKLGLPITFHPYWQWNKLHFEAIKTFLDTAAEADAYMALFETVVGHAESMAELNKEAAELAGCATDLLSRTLVHLRTLTALSNQVNLTESLRSLKQVWAQLAGHLLMLHTLAVARLELVEAGVHAYEEKRKKASSTNLGFIADYVERRTETVRCLDKKNEPLRATKKACDSIAALTDFTCRASDRLWFTKPSDDLSKTVSSIENIKATWEALKLHQLAPKKKNVRR